MSEPGPLTGIKVLDLSRVLAGPYATQRLADLGAHVIKVERPGVGDETRHWGPPWQGDGSTSAYFTSVNRGKRSIAINMADEDGLQLVRSLAAQADVVIHNLRTDSAIRLGLDFKSLSALNPKLILCRITGFSDDSVQRGRPGYDLVVQAESGLMSITGEKDGQPTKVGVAVVDVVTGLEAATAVASALVERIRGGGGCDIEVPLFDSAVASLVNVAQGAIASAEDPVRHGNAHPSIVPYEPFPTADGQIVVAVTNDSQWGVFCRALGLADLAIDSRFATNPSRVEHRDDLVSLLSSVFATKDSSEWINLLAEQGVPCGKVQSVKEALDASTGCDSTLTVTLDSGTEVVGPPQRVNGQRPFANAEPPGLGEHTDEVLETLGIDPGRIAELRSRGVVA